MRVIGYLGSATSRDAVSPFMGAFRQGLSENGYLEGQNLAIEYRWAEGHYERLPAQAVDLVDRKVDVIAAPNDVLAHGAKGATSTIPIVFIYGRRRSGRQFRPTRRQPHRPRRPHRRADAKTARTAFRAGSPRPGDCPTREPEQS
jgi:hypothetical protein